MINQNCILNPKVMTRYGKIVFSEEASRILTITENTCVKFGMDDDFSNYYLIISPRDKKEFIHIKKSGIYYFIACADILKFFGLYSPIPAIYELTKESETNGEVTYRLSKITNVKDFKFGKIFKDIDELRSIMAMLNAKI